MRSSGSKKPAVLSWDDGTEKGKFSPPNWYPQSGGKEKIVTVVLPRSGAWRSIEATKQDWFDRMKIVCKQAIVVPSATSTGAASRSRFCIFLIAAAQGLATVKL